MKPLEGKTALVTGASGGIGRVVATILAEAGAKLVLHGNRGRDILESLATTIRMKNGTVDTVYADLADGEGQSLLMTSVFERIAVPDILVLAAGLDLMSAASKSLTFDERFARIWQVDVVAAMRIARFFGKKMKETFQQQEQHPTKSGVIVFFSWDGVEHGMAGDTAQMYGAAKGAVQGLSRSLAKSLAPNVRVCCVAPGWIKTTWGETASPAMEERVARESLAKRWGTADEVAAVIRFLVSDDASYLNNQTIPVNGGRG